MREYEIYLPATRNDGSAIPAVEVDRYKHVLADAFGGYTHLKSRSEGAWRMGAVTFHDEVTILRVLDDGSANFDLLAFKKAVEDSLAQENILVIERDVRVI